MAYSHVSYTATGSQSEFVITFEIIDTTWVYVSVDGVQQSVSDYTIDADAETMTWSGSALAGGEVVKIYRETPYGDLDEVVTWAPGPVSDADLALDQKKYRHHIQELWDQYTDLDDSIGTFEAGPTMMSIMWEEDGSAYGTATGFDWTEDPPVIEQFNKGDPCRVRMKESDGYTPYENNNDDGDIAYMPLESPGTKYDYTVRLTPGTYMVRYHVTMFLTGNDTRENQARWHVNARYSDDDCTTWTEYPDQRAYIFTPLSTFPNPWQTHTSFSFSIIHTVVNSTYDYMALVAHDSDDDTNRTCGVIGGYIEITQLASA